jgi:hypothetical protein
MTSPDHNDTKSFPVWSDDDLTDVQSLFDNPQFVPAANRKATASAWYSCMANFNIFLSDTDPNNPQSTQKNNVFANVPGNAGIYAKLGPSGDMPLPTGGFSGKFPPEALEQIRIWYNQGGRVKKSDPIPSPNVPAVQIPPPTPPPPTPTRKFIIPAHPVWDAKGSADDIKMCFNNPCWISNGPGIASFWKTEMANFQYDATTDPPTMFDLQLYEHVKGWARNIYMHIAS